MTEPVNEKGQTLAQFLSDYDPSRYERPSVTADVALLTFEGEALLIRRKDHPNIGQWAFPGGFVDMTESLAAAAARELFEETGLRDVPLTLLGMYGEPTRDPRTRIFTCAFTARARRDALRFQAGDDAADAALFQIHVEKTGLLPIPAPQKRENQITLPATAWGAPLLGDCESYAISLRSTASQQVVLGVSCGVCQDGASVLLGGLPEMGPVAGDHGLLLFDALRHYGMI